MVEFIYRGNRICETTSTTSKTQLGTTKGSVEPNLSALRRVFRQVQSKAVGKVEPNGGRNRQLSADDVTDVSASTGQSGLGQINVTAKGHRYTILDQILNAEAVNFARELKQPAEREWTK